MTAGSATPGTQERHHKMSTRTKTARRNAATNGPTPVYAYLGVTDLAIEKVREVSTIPARLQDAATKVVGAAAHAPATATAKARELAGLAQESYLDLAVRGEELVERVRTQRATQELVEQAKATRAVTQGAVTTARNALSEVERSAKATVTTGRKEAAKVAGVVADTVTEDAKTVADEVNSATKRTRTAAKRTSTTAKKSTAKTRTATKRAATSARKTAAASTKAASDASTKVGTEKDATASA